MYPAVTVLAPPRSQSLISLAQVKLYRADTSTTNDPLYQRLIRDASSGMIEFLGVHPGRQQYRELSMGGGGYRRFLSRLPVEPGTLSVMLNGESLAEADSTAEASLADPLSFVLEDPATGLVFRLARWWCPTSATTYNVIDTYHAGFLLPDQISDWTASTSYASGLWVRSPSQFLTLRFECTTSGASGPTEPVWPSVAGHAVADGASVWTARAATELPDFVSQWCYVEVARLLSDLDWTPNLVSRNVMGVSESRFARKVDDGTLAPTTASGLQSWRTELGLVGVA